MPGFPVGGHIYPPNTHSVNEDNTDDDNILGMSFTGNAHEQCSVVSNTDEQNHCTLVVSQKKIQEFTIGAVQLKLNHGLSISTTEDYLRNTASLFGNKLIPTKWNNVICFLRPLGYVEPRHYKVCAARDHSYLLKLGENECKVCHKQAADCVDYCFRAIL